MNRDSVSLSEVVHFWGLKMASLQTALLGPRLGYWWMTYFSPILNSFPCSFDTTNTSVNVRLVKHFCFWSQRELLQIGHGLCCTLKIHPSILYVCFGLRCLCGLPLGAPVWRLVEKVFFFPLILPLAIDEACQRVRLVTDCWELGTRPSPMSTLAETGGDKWVRFQV